MPSVTNDEFLFDVRFFSDAIVMQLLNVLFLYRDALQPFARMNFLSVLTTSHVYRTGKADRGHRPHGGKWCCGNIWFGVLAHFKQEQPRAQPGF